MKTIIAFVLAVALAALGALYLSQRHEAAAHQAELASLREEVDQKSQQLEQARASRKEAARDHEELLGQITELNAQIQAQKAPARPASAAITTGTSLHGDSPVTDTNKGGFGNMFSKMMADPEMKQMMRQQQVQMMDQLYKPLFKQMGLTPEETQKFKDLMADNAMKGVDKAGALFGGGSATNLAETSSALVADSTSNADQLKQLLGDDRYAQYTNYQQSVGERSQLNAFQMTGGADATLTDQQTEQLLAIMQQARQNVATTTGQPVLNSGPGQDGPLQALTSPEQLDKLMQNQETINQQVYERAKEVLSADQLQSFGRFQTNQLQMMRVGMKMAQKMFVPDNPAAGATQPGQ